MKLLVETTGEFQLVDYTQKGGFVLPADRPCLTPSTSFVQANISSGKLRILTELPDDATDEDFAEALAGAKDTLVAVEAFKAEFEPKKAPTSKKKSSKDESDE